MVLFGFFFYSNMLNTTSARNSLLFTATQWHELEHQALIYKYMVSGVPVPPELLYSVKRSLESSLASRLFPHQPSKLICGYFFECFFLFNNKKRCSEESWECVFLQLGGVVFRRVLAEKQTQSQEGAEERMERNGGAQKKHTQTPSTVSGTCTEARIVQESLWNLHQLLQQQRQQQFL